jgi:hypothetical protein
MNLFIRRVIFFIFIINIFFVLFSLLYILILPQKYSIYHNGKKLTEDKIYIFGNSHPECAINDSLFSKKYLNLSQSAQPLFYTTIIVQNLIKNIKIDTIIIEFGNNALTSINWVLDDVRFSNQYKKYFALMSLNQHYFLFRNSLKMSLLSFLFLNPFDIFKYNNIEGGYLYLARDYNIIKHEVKIEAIPKKIYDPEIERKNYEALFELIQKNPSIFFIFTRMPLHHNFYTNEKEYYLDVKNLIKFKNVKYIDFTNNLKLPDSCFGDPEHLNYKGANIFTPIFDSLISKK